MDVCFVALWMIHLNIVVEGCFETLLNNRLLLKGITFAKMYDTSRQEPFCIKITWLINLTDVALTQVQQDCGRNFFVAKSYACNKRKEECIVRYTQQKRNFFTSKSYECNILKVQCTLKIEYDHISKAKWMEVNMKKGKSRNKRKKTRSRLLWIAIAVIGIAAVISAVWIKWNTRQDAIVELRLVGCFSLKGWWTGFLSAAEKSQKVF